MGAGERVHFHDPAITSFIGLLGGWKKFCALSPESQKAFFDRFFTGTAKENNCQKNILFESLKVSKNQLYN